ncbi:MAG: S1 RNA-binding domain-containing protein [Candidatus Woesebacteria bacterium]
MPKKVKAEGQEPVVEKVEKTSKKAKTMEELLANTGYTLKSPKKGDLVTGIVTLVTRKLVQVDIGGKTEGIVSDKEFEAAIDYVGDLHVGDTVKAFVTSAENDRGQILLSFKRAAVDQKWDAFKDAMESGEVVTVRGLELNKGGMIVSYEGVRGFVPTSQFGKSVIGDLENLLGKPLKVKVIEVDRDKNRLIFSERHVSEEELIKQKTAALDAVKIGEIYEGVVSGILSFGAFVTLTVPMEDKSMGHIEGLVHISEISWEKVEDPNKYMKSGDTVKVKVLAVDQSSGKLTLSIKQTINDPWAEAKEKYPEGTVVSGTVSRIAQFGIFVHLEAGIDGLVHISKIVNTDMPRVGEDVSVTVESVDPEARRMSLSLTPTEVPIGYK